MVKVFRIDTPDGEYYTLTEEEMNKMFTPKEIQAFKNDDQTFFYETKYTLRQLSRARRLHSIEDYRDQFEEDHGISPSVYDILQYLYD